VAGINLYSFVKGLDGLGWLAVATIHHSHVRPDIGIFRINLIAFLKSLLSK
jgi:ABC-type uncharacterized transport system permease subunit